MNGLISTRTLVLCFVIALVAVNPWAAVAAEFSPTPIVLIVVEGLRPEFITKQHMPALYKLSKSGLYSTAHHAVYPPIPSVNAASLVTGAYPSHHGIIGDVFLDPASGDSITADTATLDVPSLGEMLNEHGMGLTIIGGPRGRARYFTASTTPPVLTSDPSSITDAYLRVGPEASADLTVVWFAQRDGSALRAIDKQLARIFAHHRGRKDRVNFFVTSSHGVVSTTSRPVDLAAKLVEHGLKASADSLDVRVVGGNAIDVEDHDRRTIGEIASWLQQQPWAGAIFTQQARPTHPEGFARGVLSFQAVYMDHPRAPDILVEGAWSPGDDGLGIAQRIGAENPATSSPFAIDIPLIAAGPDIPKRATSDIPSANYDLAPTILHLLGIKAPPSVDGRILHEILRDGPKPEDVPVLVRRHGAEARSDGNRYRIVMQESTVDGVEYLDHINVEKR